MNIGNGIFQIKEVWREKDDRKPFIQLTRDLGYWIIKNRGGVFYFNLFRLQRKGRRVGDYLTIAEYLRIHEELDTKYYRPLLEDKILFDIYARAFKIPTPEMLGIIDKGNIFWMGEKIFEEIESILKKNMHAYCKRVTAWGGIGVFKIDVESGTLYINNKKSTMEAFNSLIGEEKFILQRTVIQHGKLKEINPNCVNTLRIYTIRDNDKPVYYSSVLRMGVGDSVVDNVSSNNLAVGIGDEGYLMEEAHSGTNPPVWYTHHPNSKVKLKDFQVPYFKEACELCCKGHLYFSNFFFIAWDIAITPEGPVVIEANPAADLYGPQVFIGGQKKRFLSFVSDYVGTQSANIAPRTAFIRRFKKVAF